MHSKSSQSDFRLSVMYMYDKHTQLPIHTQKFYCKCYHTHRLDVMKAHKQTHLYFCSSYATPNQSNSPVHYCTRRYAFNRHYQWIIKHYTISTDTPCTGIFNTFRPTVTNPNSVQQLIKPFNKHPYTGRCLQCMSQLVDAVKVQY
jgi:hypothetical protein